MSENELEMAQSEMRARNVRKERRVARSSRHKNEWSRSNRGSVRLIKRKLKHDQWWLEIIETVDGESKQRSYCLGSIRELPTKEEARAAADALIMERGQHSSIAEMLRRRYEASKLRNFTMSWYMQKVAEQAGKCAICERIPKKLVVDHDHEDGELRGLLCQQCNSAIGMLRDNAALVRKALLYLEAHGQ